MNFLLEEIDLEKIKQLYFLRGYKEEGDENYCMSMVLLGDKDEFKIALFSSSKLLTIKEGKELIKYLSNTGMKLTAEVLKTDFDRFYNTRAFEKIKV